MSVLYVKTVLGFGKCNTYLSRFFIHHPRKRQPDGLVNALAYARDWNGGEVRYFKVNHLGKLTGRAGSNAKRDRERRAADNGTAGGFANHQPGSRGSV